MHSVLDACTSRHFSWTLSMCKHPREHGQASQHTRNTHTTHAAELSIERRCAKGVFDHHAIVIIRESRRGYGVLSKTQLPVLQLYSNVQDVVGGSTCGARQLVSTRASTSRTRDKYHMLKKFSIVSTFDDFSVSFYQYSCVLMQRLSNNWQKAMQ